MKQLGDHYEDEAMRLVQARGLCVLARNFSGKPGEIDIIARDGAHLVFVEVRGRSNRHFNSAAGSVDLRKQRRIIHTAQYYLQQHPELASLPCRFDVIAYEPPQSTSSSRVRWIRGAFTA